MKLNLDSLKQVGAFIGRPVEKEITWKQGDKRITATVYIRSMGYYDAVSNALSAVGKIDGVAGCIVASICDESGASVFTVADITSEADPERGVLDGALTAALPIAIQQVNDLGKVNSAQMTDSGANQFSTGSTVIPLLKQKNALALPSIATGFFIVKSTEALTK